MKTFLIVVAAAVLGGVVGRLNAQGGPRYIAIEGEECSAMPANPKTLKDRCMPKTVILTLNPGGTVTWSR